VKSISFLKFALEFYLEFYLNKDWGCVILREIDFPLKLCWSIPCLHPPWKVHTWIEIGASLNHHKKTTADGSRLIPRKHTETLVLFSVLPFRCSIPSYAWNHWRMVRLWSTRHLTVHAFLSKFSRQFEDVFSWNFLVFSHFAKTKALIQAKSKMLWKTATGHRRVSALTEYSRAIWFAPSTPHLVAQFLAFFLMHRNTRWETYGTDDTSFLGWHW